MIRKITNALICAALIITAFVLQSTLFKAAAIGGISPNLIVIVTASLSLFMGDRAGLFIGFFAGFICDVLFSPVIGFLALVYAVTGFLCGKLRNVLFVEDIGFPLIMIAAADLFVGFVRFVFEFMMRNRLFFGHFLGHYIIPEIIYTVMVAATVYPLLSLLYRRVMRDKPESQKREEGTLV